MCAEKNDCIQKTKSVFSQENSVCHRHICSIS